MPNAYASLAEIRAAMPGAIQSSNNDLNPLLMRLAGEVSRWIDNYCQRAFYPLFATRYFYGSGHGCLRVPDLLSITSISISYDYGVTYTTLSASDYIATVEGDENSPRSYTEIRAHPTSTNLVYWPAYYRGVKIVGVWAYADDRDKAWESTGDTVQNAPLADSGASLTVTDVDGADAFGLAARFSPGQVLKIESEYVETLNNSTYSTSSNTIGISRAANGTTAAAHAQNTAIYVWRPPEPVKQAVIIQIVQMLERGLQSYGDARATAEVGQLFFVKALDPAARDKLSTYRLLEFA